MRSREAYQLPGTPRAVVLHETRTSGITPASTMPDEELPRLIADGNLQAVLLAGIHSVLTFPSMSAAFAEHLWTATNPTRLAKTKAQPLRGSLKNDGVNLAFGSERLWFL